MALRTRLLRPRLLVGVAVLLAACVVGGYVAAGMIGGGGSSTQSVASVTQVKGPSQTNARYPGATVTSPEPKPDITLTDTSGQAYNIVDETRGKVTLLYFGYTNCPNLCPINMALAARAIASLSAAARHQVTMVFVTIDARRDTLGVMRSWLDKFDRSFVGLRGTTAQVRRAEAEVGQPLSFVEGTATGDYQFEHADYVLAYAKSGQSHLQLDISESVADYATTLRHLVSCGYRS